VVLRGLETKDGNHEAPRNDNILIFFISVSFNFDDRKNADFATALNTNAKVEHNL